MHRKLFFILIWGVAPILAQLPSDPAKLELEATIQGKKDALEAFKNGDKAAGLEKLKGNVSKRVSSPKEEVQINAQLVEISHWLANEQHPRTKEVALLALEEMGKSRGKLNRDEDASTVSAMGQLYEHLVGDPVKAKASYEAAIALNSRDAEAAKGLARLKSLAALIEEKARENEALRLRALNPGR